VTAVIIHCFLIKLLFYYEVWRKFRSGKNKLSNARSWYSVCDPSFMIKVAVLTFLGPGARFSKVPIINGPGKLSPFTLKIEVSIVLHLTW